MIISFTLDEVRIILREEIRRRLGEEETIDNRPPVRFIHVRQEAGGASEEETENTSAPVTRVDVEWNF